MILSCLWPVQQLDPGEPAGAEGEGPGCKRRFELNDNNGEPLHLSSDELIALSMNRRTAGRRTGIVPAVHNMLHNSI